MDFQSIRINGDRLMQRIEDLATIGPHEDTGSCRLALTDEDRDGRDLVVTWMKDLGLEITIDGIGNVIATRPGKMEGPPTLTGSHIDTVATGGRYDGNLGVLAGIELIETLIENDITTRYPVGVAFFTDEEGARFPPDMLGSLVYVGGLALEQALEVEGIDGAILGEELDRIGYRGSAPCPGIPPRAFVELHIEQGPLLETEETTIGIVTGVQGISWTEYSITGQSNHAGTTPMHLRHDAGYVAARITTEAREIAKRMGGRQVATVGRMQFHPDLINVVAREARLTVDLRNTDEALLLEAENQMETCIRSLEESEGVVINSRSLARFEPVVFDSRVINIVSETSSQLNFSSMQMPSGAGHDAQMLARVCPTGMIFVPSRDGISHNPSEHTDRDDLIAGANTLLQSILTLDAKDLSGVEQ
ncbi:MAG TPA: M20 family metallo-hydrolase [Acidimicrobiales bacterium]|nr:M20 family metallo-hydrolase [Acidimicrobiales bacterium]|tara:strand:+ start:3691 stop:4947 length:1257 start_codon:yes stop_codon:yes gene_type:complete